MKKIVVLYLIAILTIQFGWSQNIAIVSDLKEKVEILASELNTFECNELDPLSLNATLVWSKDKSQLAIVMKANLLSGWHIYSYVPKTQPYITTELELELPKGITTIGEWLTPIDEAYDDGVYIYHGVLVFVQYCSVNDYNAKDSDIVKCGLYYQTCDLNKCFPPKTKELRLNI